MRNNKIKKISVGDSGHSSHRFDCTHDINSTLSFGDVEPLEIKLLTPNSKVVLGDAKLTRLAPMPAPCFGRIKQKTWHMAVPLNEIFPNMENLLSQIPVARTSGVGIPVAVPRIKTSMLTSLMFVGSASSAWIPVDAGGNPVTLNAATRFVHSETDGDTHVAPFSWLSALRTVLTGVYGQNTGNIPAFDFTGYRMKLNTLLGIETQIRVPSSVGVNGCADSYEGGQKVSVVSLKGADYVLDWEITGTNTVFDGKTILIAFKLSDFGKRLRKIFVQAGYPLDMYSQTEISLLPLFAYYRGYYELFGINLYTNFEQSSLFKLIQYCTQNFFYDFSDSSSSSQFVDTTSDFWNFIRDLGNCWVTDTTDYINAHTSTPDVVPNVAVNRPLAFAKGFVDVSSSSPLANSYANDTRQVIIDAVSHGQLDSEVVKLMYKWTNRYTVEGQNLGEILRSLGFGDFVDECKVAFVGYSEMDIEVMDISAQADTFDGENGSLLGEWAGKAVKYDKSKKFTFEADNFTYLISYTAIVPISGYSQSADHTVYATEQMDFYNPEFDGLGKELTRFAEIVGYPRLFAPSSMAGGSVDRSFGYIPRHTGWKVSRNVLNGDFSLGSRKDTYAPYFLDKFIPVGEFDVDPVAVPPEGYYSEYKNNGIANFANVPTAGVAWKYNSRYRWLGYFDRIFANVGESPDWNEDSLSSGNALTTDYCTFNVDNFVMHCIYFMDYHACMKPIEMSFETFDDDKTPNGSVTKA